jgi:hypothetical protein
VFEVTAVAAGVLARRSGFSIARRSISTPLAARKRLGNRGFCAVL